MPSALTAAAVTTISKSILFCVAVVVGAHFPSSNLHFFFCVFVVYIAKKIPFFKNLNVFFYSSVFFTEKSPFETQLTRKTTRLRMRFCVWLSVRVCVHQSVLGWLPMCWFLLTNLYGFFFTVCECVLGEKFAMSSPRALVCVVCIVSSLLNFICSCLFVCYLTNFTYILKAYG